jgi:hypothetical protein
MINCWSRVSVYMFWTCPKKIALVMQIYNTKLVPYRKITATRGSQLPLCRFLLLPPNQH